MKGMALDLPPTLKQTRQKEARAGEDAFHVAVHNRRAYAGQRECAQCGMVKEPIVAQVELELGNEIPCRAYRESVKPLVAGGMLITTAEFEVMLCQGGQGKSKQD